MFNGVRIVIFVTFKAEGTNKSISNSLIKTLQLKLIEFVISASFEFT
jgi:hypothetical protein